MAAHENFLPPNFDELEVWLKNFSEKKTASGDLFGFDLTSIGQTNNDYQYLKMLNADINSGRVVMISKTAYRDEIVNKTAIPTDSFQLYVNPTLVLPSVPAGIISRIYADDLKIKGTTGVYNETWGNAFGLIGTEIIFRPDDYIPVITIKIFSDRIEVHFVKHGADGIMLYKKAGSDPTYVKIDKFTKSPAVFIPVLTVAGKAENISFYANGIKNDILIGHPCNPTTVPFGGPPV